ncbi:serine/threonine-protein kinase [Gemmatimonas sp.]|uniref:serine/threonine-protein kinase n=1 Tax=Gemmatimonas sp. TaxID=1962908 RepID=UPI0031C0750C|nr:serine/threonine protein kinase [Gemmatimonas sp.]
MIQTRPAGNSDLRERLQRQLGDGYVINRELDGGGSSRVFLATEVALERSVVLKVLPAVLTDGVDGARFRREILIAARLQHPHLVPLLSAGDTDSATSPSSCHWYSMPYVEGHSLRELLTRRGALPMHEALRLLRELATALTYAHAKGVVHRDIKPENVLLCEGAAMISDFGVAKALDDASAEALNSGRRLTTVSMTLGTPAYMAPEQVNNATVVDHKADLYAFACLAYELLTGSAPLVRTSLRATIVAQLSETPVPVCDVRPDTPASVADILMRCLEKDPLQRPHSASAIVKVLDALAMPTSSRTPADAAAVASGAPRRGVPRMMIVAGALLVAAAAYWIFLR